VQRGQVVGVGLVKDGRAGGVGERPLVGGLGAVVGFADFGADAGLGQQLLRAVYRLIFWDTAGQIRLRISISPGRRSASS
jgi:hypothetical protein